VQPILGWYHWPCNLEKYRFYIAARTDTIIISKLAATDPAALTDEMISIVATTKDDVRMENVFNNTILGCVL